MGHQGGVGSLARRLWHQGSALVDSHGHALAFHLAPGQAHEAPLAPALLDMMQDDVPLWVVADKGLSSAAIREHIRAMGARPVIPAGHNEAPVLCPDWIYWYRNEVARLWSRLTEWRAVATWYEKLTRLFMGMFCPAASLDWLKAFHKRCK